MSYFILVCINVGLNFVSKIPGNKCNTIVLLCLHALKQFQICDLKIRRIQQKLISQALKVSKQSVHVCDNFAFVRAMCQRCGEFWVGVVVKRGYSKYSALISCFGDAYFFNRFARMREAVFVDIEICQEFHTRSGLYAL